MSKPLDYDLMIDWVQPPRKCSADAVWIVQCGVSGDRDLVYKPLYGTWFYDAEKRTPSRAMFGARHAVAWVHGREVRAPRWRSCTPLAA